MVEGPAPAYRLEDMADDVVFLLPVVIDDSQVSRKHCRVFCEGGLWFAEDMNSSNGTFVNGEKIKRAKLNEGDRILIGTSFILLLTGIAPFIGSRMTGLLTTIPLYVTILSIFAHRDHGPAAAAHVLRGLLYGMFAFTGFFLVLSLLIEKTSLGVSFGLAALTALLVQGTSLLILRKLHG